MRWLRGAFLGLVAVLGAACSASPARTGGAGAAMIAKVKAELQPLPGSARASLSPAQQAYLDYYGIRADSGACRFGTFESGGLTLAGRLIAPSRKGKGTVVVVHGYLDHAGCASHLVNRLLAEGYGVAAYDMPGHGLSEGRRVSVDDFSTYEVAFSDFLDRVRSLLPPPYDVVAHSMGGTVVVDHLLAHEDSPLRRVVLVAPMIRDATPRAVRCLGHALSPLVDYLPRIPEDNSSDPEFTALLKADPLQPRVVSSRWSRRFHEWQRRVEDSPPSKATPLVFEAAVDTVIDRPYTRQWIRRTFPGSRFVIIEGGRHHLLNEAAPLRERVLDAICAELRG